MPVPSRVAVHPAILRIARAAAVVSKEGETINLPDDDERLEAGGDRADGPRWMELWSPVSPTQYCLPAHDCVGLD
jgi:hypothetical protein